MGGVAQIAKQMGHQVSGCDSAFYQPMAGQLEKAGIECTEGCDERVLASCADLYLIGNVVRRGNLAFEAILAEQRPFVSAPQWIAENCLARHRKVIAVAGTHGKTTVAAMVAHILAKLGFDLSYLIGGVPGNFAVSAKMGNSEVMVIEADEYDTALFDKRPKFMHYWADVIVMNNIEFDHADIYPDLDAIVRQFTLLPRMLKSNGVLIANWADDRVRAITAQPEWYECEKINNPNGWHWTRQMAGLQYKKRQLGSVGSLPTGAHNHSNALAALAACCAIKADPQAVLDALEDFILPARRMQVVYDQHDVTLIDDFAHHPTAITAVLKAIKNNYKSRRIVAMFEPCSNTMRAGHWRDALAASFADADLVYVLKQNIEWDVASSLTSLNKSASVYADIRQLQAKVLDGLLTGDVMVMLSNGNFAGLRQNLPLELSMRGAS